MKQLNNQFALVDILLCYHGDNRNGTSISKDVIEKALPSLYGIPIVGEYIYLDDGTQDFGSHGGKIIISDKGIKFEDTTKPYGFITRDAVDNAKWVTITEKNGIDKHEYLELPSCIVWEKRYEEVSSLLDKNYGQSMEIIINSGKFNEKNYFVVEDFTFSAACILGSNPDGTEVSPCFESAYIGRHYELDSFKQEFSQMLDEYNKLTETDGSNTFTDTSVPNKNETNPQKGDLNMDLSKFTEILSTNKISEESDISKYRLLNVSDSKVFALDMEDYKPYGFDYAITKEGETDAIIIDFESQVEMSLSAVEKITDENFEEFSIKNEIETIKEQYAKTMVDETTKKISETMSAEFSKDYDDLKEAYDTLEKSHKLISEKLADFEKKEAELKESAHRKEIDDLVNSYAEKLGKYSKFLVYKAQIEDKYSMETSAVEQELILMAGKYLTSNEHQQSTKRNFSYNPTETKVNKKNENTTSSRYGNLLDKFM